MLAVEVTLISEVILLMHRQNESTLQILTGAEGAHLLSNIIISIRSVKKSLFMARVKSSLVLYLYMDSFLSMITSQSVLNFRASKILYSSGCRSGI